MQDKKKKLLNAGKLTRNTIAHDQNTRHGSPKHNDCLPGKCPRHIRAQNRTDASTSGRSLSLHLSFCRHPSAVLRRARTTKRPPPPTSLARGAGRSAHTRQRHRRVLITPQLSPPVSESTRRRQQRASSATAAPITRRAGTLDGAPLTLNRCCGEGVVQKRPQSLRLFLMMTSVTASNTNWMLLVSVAHVKWV